ncbi:hypothetical protein HELRODRAFT_167705 [Helobdella robusta]|uniref:Uncharacterized protein n=1 Tax=Helobdella robusta TaxID=6412 RepID=T1EZP7_HELRO|nr:hypothetical protein HELRODRAFT_167705 [Helobdella robusta]ESO09887.1 hypothetical protein HELRODRAFT_167705 [Helobdella robusta]
MAGLTGVEWIHFLQIVSFLTLPFFVVRLVLLPLLHIVNNIATERINAMTCSFHGWLNNFLLVSGMIIFVGLLAFHWTLSFGNKSKCSSSSSNVGGGNNSAYSARQKPVLIIPKCPQ